QRHDILPAHVDPLAQPHDMLPPTWVQCVDPRRPKPPYEIRSNRKHSSRCSGAVGPRGSPASTHAARSPTRGAPVPVCVPSPAPEAPNLADVPSRSTDARDGRAPAAARSPESHRRSMGSIGPSTRLIPRRMGRGGPCGGTVTSTQRVSPGGRSVGSVACSGMKTARGGERRTRGGSREAELAADASRPRDADLVGGDPGGTEPGGTDPGGTEPGRTEPEPADPDPTAPGAPEPPSPVPPPTEPTGTGTAAGGIGGRRCVPLKRPARRMSVRARRE